MEKQLTVSALLAARRRHDTMLFIMLFLALLSFLPLLTFWGLNAGLGVVLGAFVVVIVAIALVRWPVLSLYLIAACTFAVEQEPLRNPAPIGTDHLYIFYWPPQMEGFIERPIGVLIVFALSVWIFHCLVKRQPLLRGGALIGPFTLYILCVIAATVYGIVTGGNQKVAVVQFRPFWYMFLSYILAYNFVTHKNHIRSFFWLAIISAGFKGVQGLYVYLILYHGNLEGQYTILSHEESFFFVSLLLLLIIFWLYHRYRPQMLVCLCIAPAVLISLVANQRRADYIALLVGIGFAWVMIFVLKPEARRALLIGMMICATLGIAYVQVFSQTQGGLGSPARSIVGVFDPSVGDSRDILSNLYRTYEDDDLKYTAKHYPLGLGFGRPFLQPKPLVSIFPDVLASNPYYNYIPHNTIYWVWVDLGPIGFFALWFLIGSIIIRGCFIVRQLKDPYLQVVAIYIVTVTAMEVVMAFADYQLFFYRNVIDLGLLCGLLVKLPVLDKEQKEHRTYESVDGVSIPSQPLVGGMHSQLSSPQSTGPSS